MASYFPMVKNADQRIVFPILDADGDPVTGAATDTPDSEYSLDGGSFSNITDEIHELATNSGVYYLDILAAECNGDVVAIQVKTATAGTKTTVLVFYTSTQALNTIDTNVDTLVARLTAARATKLDELGSANIPADIDKLIQILTGKWEITSNQLIMYDSDGTTPLYTFDLTRDGVASEYNPDKREAA